MDPVEIVDIRQVTDLETARVLMEPSRLAILRTLANKGLRKLTVKEIAEELGEGQTKLYRHIKQLEEHGLIHVAETRVVSGIIEKRYASSQKRLRLDNDVLGLFDDPVQIDRQIAATLDTARDYLHTELRAGRIALHPAEEGPNLQLYSAYSSTRLTPERFSEFRAALSALVDGYSEKEEAPTGIPVLLHALLFAVVDPADPAAGPGTDPAVA